MNQPLAIVGASARAAAASALRAGYFPLAADLFADVDLRRIATATRISPYPEGLLDWLRAVEPPAWIYTGALENYPELVDQMAWIAPLWGNPGDVLVRVRSPWQLGTALRGAGLLFPETRLTADGLPRDGSWLAKTYRGASGSGVSAWGEKPGATSEEPGREEARSEANHPVCYQEHKAGISCAAAFVAAGGTASLLGVTRQLVGEPWLGAHGFQYAGSIGPMALEKQLHDNVTLCGNALAEHFQLIGLFGVDFILEADRLWTLEVNPRYTASIEIIERATGIDAIALHAAACSGSPVQSAPSEIRDPKVELAGSRKTYGKAILYARHEVVISDEFAALAMDEASRRPCPMLADIAAPGTLIEARRPILTVFAEGATDADVEHELRERVAALEGKLYTA